MAIFKRGNVYWYHFLWNGDHIQKSTAQGNLRVARQMQAAHQTALAKGEAGIFERKPAPTLREFRQRFVDSVRTRSAEKPLTVLFYESKFARLLEFTPLAQARLDKIDEALIESFVQHRREVVRPASVNRELATLRKALRLAMKWRIIDRVPSFKLLDGERERTYVLSHRLEEIYLGFAPQPLRDVAVLILDTGLRVGEALSLEWADIRLHPVNGATFGYLHVRKGKTKHAKRNVPLAERVRVMLESRQAKAAGLWVFPNEDASGPVSRFTVRDQHVALRERMHLPTDFVIHSLRHSALTRLGESGVDAFTIMRIAGHSSITVSQKYVHPSPEAVERAFERLEALNQRAAGTLAERPRKQLPATVSATLETAAVDAQDQPV
jgi:integrase